MYPYGLRISLERAQDVINAVTAEAKKRDWKMNLAVVAGGNLVAFQRMNGGMLASNCQELRIDSCLCRLDQEESLIYVDASYS